MLEGHMAAFPVSWHLSDPSRWHTWDSIHYAGCPDATCCCVACFVEHQQLLWSTAASILSGIMWELYRTSPSHV